jgi:hypothetical protein
MSGLYKVTTAGPAGNHRVPMLFSNQWCA